MKRFSHKTGLLFSAILLLLLALPISALADGGTGGNEFTQTVSGYQVTLVFEKPAAVGENQIPGWGLGFGRLKIYLGQFD